MVLENPVDDALVGATFRCLIGDTLGRLRFGDRFFYDNKGQAGSFTIGDFTPKFSICLLNSRVLGGGPKFFPFVLGVRPGEGWTIVLIKKFIAFLDV